MELDFRKTNSIGVIVSKSEVYSTKGHFNRAVNLNHQ